MTPRRALSQVRRVGPWRIAALEEWSISAWSLGRTLGGGGNKAPLAILFAGPQGTQVFSPDGTPLTAAELDALHPGAMQSFMNDATHAMVDTGENEEEDQG